MIADLGDLLRVTMEDAQQQEVPLAREMEYLDHYLDIARTRFGSSLKVERRVADELRDAMVPSLVLQPLVENSLRYGLAERNGRSRITIEASRVAGGLRLQVSDNGPGLPLASPGPVRMGLGLGNTRRRLEQLYGDGQRLEIRNRPEGGAVAVLELPYRPLNGSHDNADSGFFYDDPHSYRGRRAAGAGQDSLLPGA
jgi:LytS/YehU family sensor histidine kinase